MTYIEVSIPAFLCTEKYAANVHQVLDFGASRDGVPPDQRGRRIVVNSKGHETEDLEDIIEADAV